MRKLTITLVLTILVIGTFGQRWEKIYGHPDYKEWADGVIEMYDKGYFILGSTLNQDMEWNFKTGINGDTLYNKWLYHESYIHRDHGIATDTNGNQYISSTLFTDNTNWPMVSKFDSCGQKAWCRVFVDNYFDQGSGMDILHIDNDRVLVLVNHDMEDHIDQAVLYCLDKNGNFLWKKVYASKNNYPLLDNLVVYNLNAYNNSYFIDGYCYWAYPGNPNHVYLRPLFIKVDSNFKEEWVLPFGIYDSIVGETYGTIPLNDSVYFGIGVRVSSATYNQNSLLMFFNDQGEELGFKQLSNEEFGDDVEFNLFAKIAPVDDTTFVSKYYIGKNDTVFHGEAIIDTSGNLHKTVIRGTSGALPDMIKTSDGNFLVAIETDLTVNADIWLYKFDKNLEDVPFDTTQRVYDSLCPHAIPSGTIDLSNCLIVTNVSEAPGPAQYYESLRWIPVKAYPNPVKDGKVTLEFENTDHHSNMELHCYNNLGRQIQVRKIYKGQQDTDVNVSAWTKGVYIAVIYSNGGAVGKVKFVVR